MHLADSQVSEILRELALALDLDSDLGSVGCQHIAISETLELAMVPVPVRVMVGLGDVALALVLGSIA